MTYWKIAAAFSVISLAGVLYSMFKHEDYDPGFPGILQDLGLRVASAMLLGAVWPITFIGGIVMILSCFKYPDESKDND